MEKERYWSLSTNHVNGAVDQVKKVVAYFILGLMIRSDVPHVVALGRSKFMKLGTAQFVPGLVRDQIFE